MIIKLGPRKAEILRAAMDGEWFPVGPKGTLYSHCLILFQRGHLKRDFPDIFRFAITPQGLEAIREHDRKAA